MDSRVPAFFHGEDDVRDAIARKLVPPALTEEFGQVRRTVAESVERLRNDLTGVRCHTGRRRQQEPRRRSLYQLSKIEHKTARETLKRNDRATADASYMFGLIFPDKHLQERYYSILPFLARHGVGDLMDTLYQHVRLECPDHQVLVV